MTAASSSVDDSAAPGRDPLGRRTRRFAAAVRSLLDAGIDRCLVRPVSSFPLAVTRIGIGCALVAWAATMVPDFGPLLSDDAIVSPQFATSAFGITLTGDVALSIALALVAIAGVAIAIGLRPTAFALVGFVALVLVQRRDPLILNSGDLVLRNLTLLLAVTPSAAALSLDRRLAHGAGSLRTAPLIAPWGMRLIQLQIAVVYLFAFWSKSGSTWHDGTAVSIALRLDDLERFAAPSFLTDGVLVVAALTWGTLAVELALAVGLWYRPARPALIVLGVLFHLFIDTFLLVGFFGVAMLAGLASFLPGRGVERAVGRLAGRGRSDRSPREHDVAG